MQTTSIIKFTEQDLRDNLGTGFLVRGKQYQHQGMVQQCFVEDGGFFIRGKVKGQSEDYYHVSIDITDINGRINITGECDCFVGYNCKHVAALLYQVLGDTEKLKKRSDAKQKHGEWAGFLEELTEIAEEAYSSEKDLSKTREIIYILSTDDDYLGIVFKVSVYLVNILKKGGYGQQRDFSLHSYNQHSFIQDADKIVLHHLEVIENQSNYYMDKSNEYLLKGELARQIIPLMIKTNRCFLFDKNTRPLSLGEPINAIFEWETLDSGLQLLNCNLGKNYVPIATVPPWYISTQDHTFGPISSPIKDELAAKLINSPALLPEHTKPIKEALSKKLKFIPAPKVYDKKITKRINMIPCIHLFMRTVVLEDKSNPNKINPVELPLLQLSFKYGKRKVKPTEDGDTVTYLEGDNIVSTKRDKIKERQAVDILASFALTPGNELPVASGIMSNPTQELKTAWLIGNYEDAQSMFDFLMNAIPQLRKNNWEVEAADDFPLEFITDEDWYTEIEDELEGQYNWFGFQLGIMVNNQKLNILPLLVNLIQTSPILLQGDNLKNLPDDHKFYLPLPDKRYVSLTAARVKDILSVLVELYNGGQLEDGKLKVTGVQAGDLIALNQNLKARWLGDKKLKTLGEKLAKFKGIKQQSIPKGLKGELREYQHQGLNWLMFLREHQLGGILADDMGLGKTIQILTLLLAHKNSRKSEYPSLIIAPTSLMINWANECERFTPSLKLLTLHGDDRHQKFHQIQLADIVLSTYPLIHRDSEILLKHKFDYLILDEAQYIKNSKTKSYQTLLDIKAKHTLCMTGTPMENNLGELWSLFNFTVPGLLGDYKKFKQLFADPIEKDNEISRQRALAKRVAPFMLRRTKEQVVTELPPKTEIIHTIDMAGPQQDLYESIRLTMEQKVRSTITEKGLNRSHIEILDALLKLRQTCNHPQLLKLDAAQKVQQSAKLEFLLDMLNTLIEEGRKVLLFSTFSSMLTIIQSELKAMGIKHTKLTGATKDRATPINQFQNGNIPIMLISLKAGGTGLNLTAADTVIHYDPWWNPQAESQATDRAHRIGQDKPVFVYKLVCKGTVEEKILKMQENKKRLMDGLFKEQQGYTTKLTAKDLAYLFEPI